MSPTKKPEGIVAPLQLCGTVRDESIDHLVIPISIVLGPVAIDTFAMIDSGASTIFMDRNWASNHSIHREEKETPQPVFAINGTRVEGGTHTTKNLGVQVGDSLSHWRMELADISHYPIILGLR